MVVFLYTSCVILNIWEVMEIKVAVAGTGYVGLSIAPYYLITIAIGVIPEKVEKLNNKISSIQDDYIESVGLRRYY